MRKDAPGPAPGFTVVETLATLALISILLAMAVPSFRSVIERQRADSALHLVNTQLAQARNTAITRRSPVTVCPSRGGGTCLSGTDWSAGWMLYLDPGRRNQPRNPGDVLRDRRFADPERLEILRAWRDLCANESEKAEIGTMIVELEGRLSAHNHAAE